VFRSLPIATVRHHAGYPRDGAWRVDTITLGWEERVKIRARRVSDQGFEFATALPRGTVLTEGDVLAFADERLSVCVREAPEAVLVIRPDTSVEWARIAYHIGNSHQPLMLSADGIVCPDGPGLEQVLTYHAIRFTRERRAFTPIAQIPDHQHALRA
jgi:urease accessory protein